ncbi:MAG: cysteine desulfurase-like protein [Actinomycetota bacterium]|nr:cysteine desulfurase-like protein [Actinomycetota bacterium]
MALDIAGIREQFPALRRTVGGRPAAYLDGPGGTQAPETVIDAMAGFMRAGGSNHGGPFASSRETDAVTEIARRGIADLFGASADEIAFGQNMTSLTLSVSRALGATWRPGDNIIVTRLDHDGNVWPWVIAARDAGAEVRWIDFDPDNGCRLMAEGLVDMLDNRTRLVAMTHASNAVGTITDPKPIIDAAHAFGALTYVDAVHYSPHGLVDVAALGTDFLAASAYKFFGPHTGCLYGRRDVLESVEAYKLRAAPNTPPDKWETGTQSFESLAGVTAAVDYIASLGAGDTRREQLRSAMAHIGVYEGSLSERFLSGIANMPGIILYGRDVPDGRTPTFAISVDGTHPDTAAEILGNQGIFVWSGDYYAVEVMRRLGVADEGGLVRIGFAHYNTAEEVDRVLTALGEITTVPPR